MTEVRYDGEDEMTGRRAKPNSEERQAQKADKGISKTEKEQKQLARVLKIWEAIKTQRPLRGRWR